MKNVKLISQFEIHQDKLKSIKTFSELVIWTRKTIDLATKHAPDLKSTIDGLNILRKVPATVRKTSTGPRNNDHLVPDKKKKAATYVNEIIDYLKHNDNPDKKSFLEKHFTVNSLATLWIATLAILVPAIIACSYYAHIIGKNAGKNENQRDINILYNQNDVCNAKVKELRDSIAILQKKYEKG